VHEVSEKVERNGAVIVEGFDSSPFLKLNIFVHILDSALITLESLIMNPWRDCAL
jgi:hypothetical protein